MVSYDNPEKTRSIKMMAMIAVILQALATVLGFAVVVLQKTLLKAFMSMPRDLNNLVFPIALIFVVLQLIIYIAFFQYFPERRQQGCVYYSDHIIRNTFNCICIWKRVGKFFVFAKRS